MQWALVALLPDPVSSHPSPFRALSWAAVFLEPLATTLIWVSTSLEACQSSRAGKGGKVEEHPYRGKGEGKEKLWLTRNSTAMASFSGFYFRG